MTKSKEEKELEILVKSQKIQNLFLPDCHLFLDYEPSIEVDNRSQLISLFLKVYKVVDATKVNFYDISIKMDEDKRKAAVDMTVIAEANDPQTYEKVRFAREVKMDWRRSDGDWMVSSVKAIKTLH